MIGNLVKYKQAKNYRNRAKSGTDIAKIEQCSFLCLTCY